jgi:phage tail sheath protein FI
MAEQFLHGVEVLEIDAGPRPIATVRSAVIGIVGTAPDSEPEVKATLLTTGAANAALTWTAKLAGNLGNKINVRLVDPKANNAALSVQVSGGTAIIVNLATGAGGAITSTAAQVKAAIEANAAAHALVGLANTGASTGAGIVAAVPATFLSGGEDEAFPLNQPTMVAGSRREAARLGLVGTLPTAMDAIFDQAGAVVVVVRVEEGADAAETLANVVGGVNGTTDDFEGVHAFLGAESKLGVSPRILIAPGFTHTRDGGDANAVVAELVGIAERLRAVIIADGPSTTDADAVQYAGDFGSKRVYLIDPRSTVLDTTTGQKAYEWSSPRVAGLICKSDNERGFWWSPSNQNVNGIIGTERAIDFKLGDVTSRANLLNESKIATIIRQDGYRLWGNRTLSADPKWVFLSVVRTADIIHDSLLRAHLWAVDRNITKTYVQDVVEGVNDYLRHLTTIGAILGGFCYADPDLNTPDQIAQGKVYFDFDFTPPYPAEHITFRSHLVNDYVKSIFD